MRTEMPLAPYGKEVIVTATFDKGTAFAAAAALLSRHNGNPWVVLHLWGQALELLLKAYLLNIDFDQYRKKLATRKFGHDLEALTREFLNNLGRQPLPPEMLRQLSEINRWYMAHALRYGSLVDIFSHHSTIESERIIRLIVTLISEGKKRKLF